MGEAVFDMALIISVREGDIPDGRIHFLFLLKAKPGKLNSVISMPLHK